jgi:hypothetical protein
MKIKEPKLSKLYNDVVLVFHYSSLILKGSEKQYLTLLKDINSHVWDAADLSA